MNTIKSITLLSLLIVCAYAQAESTPSFVVKTEKKVTKEKNVEKKVVDMARRVFDLCADVTSSLAQWGKHLSDKVFSTLENGNKQELTELLHDLRRCEKELLEIQKKIDTLLI